MSGLPEIPPHTRAYILERVEESLPVDRARIAAETGLGCEFVLSIICRVVSEKHGIPCGPPWSDLAVTRTPQVRKRPKPRTNLKHCSCNKYPHVGKCPVRIRERARLRLANRV